MLPPVGPITWVGRDSKGNLVDVTADTNELTTPIEVTSGGGGAEAPLSLTGTLASESVVALQAAAAQTNELDADPFYVANADGDKVLRVTATDVFAIETGRTGFDAIQVINRDGGANEGAFLVEIGPDGVASFASDASDTHAFSVRPLNDLDLNKVIASFISAAGTNRVQISRNAYFKFKAVAAPPDDELFAHELAFWFDSTNGAAKLMIKAKQADGTVRTGEVALT